MATEWATPQKFFDALNKEFNFTVDVAAGTGTAKCKRFYTEKENGLKQDWTGETVWMNPPYGRGQNVYEWVQKAYEVTGDPNTICVCLLPASIDTKWFHEFCLNASEIRFVKDRLWFSLNGKSQRANHGSIVVVFKKPKGIPQPNIKTMSNYKQPIG